MATVSSPHAGAHPVPGAPCNDSFTATFTWEEALREFSLHLQATRAKKTQRYYQVQLGGLTRWAAENVVPFAGFGKRHMDRYLVARAEAGRAQLTLHHDAVCAKAFFRWCQRNDLVERSLLADYEVRHAPRPARYMPTDADMQALLRAVPGFWDPARNPGCRYLSVAKRVFHRDRNYAVLIGLLDTAARIGEMLSLKVDDYAAFGRGGVERLDAPLFSAKAGSTFSPNQVSCWRQRRPSATSSSLMRLRLMGTPLLSLRYAASRSSVQQAKGWPNSCGSLSAAAMTAPTCSGV